MNDLAASGDRRCTGQPASVGAAVAVRVASSACRHSFTFGRQSRDASSFASEAEKDMELSFHEEIFYINEHQKEGPMLDDQSRGIIHNEQREKQREPSALASAHDDWATNCTINELNETRSKCMKDERGFSSKNKNFSCDSQTGAEKIQSALDDSERVVASIAVASVNSEAFEEIAEKKMMHCKRTNHSKECDLVKHLVYVTGQCIVQRYWRRLWPSSCHNAWHWRVHLMPKLCTTAALNALDSFLSAMAPAETLSKNIGRCRGITSCTMLERFGQGKKVRLPTHLRA
eukprot:scaffold1833_cov158-Skeletonema_dohrnii-CCMP3373.AAC.2